jgi:hypothetical protein
MNKQRVNNKYILNLFLVMVFGLLIPQESFSQSERLGNVGYASPIGFTKTLKENLVAFSSYDQATGKFCIMTLYGATPGTGRAESDFKREWANLVVKSMSAEQNPKTESHTESGWTVTGGGSPVEFDGGKAFALLTVMSGGGRTVSVLGVFNDESYVSALAAFSESVVLGKAVAETPATTPAPQIQNGRLVIPPITRQLTIADLVGEWGENAGITTTYIDRYTGTYAGFESLHFTSKMTITPAGGFLNDFFAIQNGRKIKENTSGSVSISGRVLSIRHKNTAKYVIRGWLELPDITILEICGPWFDNDVIPADIFTNPDKGWNLDKKWVRKR